MNPTTATQTHSLNCDGRPLGYKVRMERPWSCSCGAKFFGYDTPVFKAFRDHKREEVVR